MAGKRIYITIPRHEFELLRHLSMQGQECPSMWCKREVLMTLYTRLANNPELQAYDALVSAEERKELLRGRRG